MNKVGMTHALDYRRTLHASYMGYVVQAAANCFAPLLFITFQQEFAMPLHLITLLVTLNFTIQLLIDLLSMKIIDALGYRFCVMAADIAAAAGFVCLGSLPYLVPAPYAGVVISVVLYAVGGGLMEVMLSPIVEACPFDNKAAVMAMLHSFYSWGCVAVILCSTAFFAVAGVANWRTLSCLQAAVPLINALMFARCPLPTLVSEGEGMSVRSLLRTRVVWLLFALMVCSGAAEQAMSQWASAFAEGALGISKTTGDLLGPCLFALLMGTSRALFGKLGSSKTLTAAMVSSCALCVASYLAASLSLNSWVALAGCVVCGFSVGVMWPGVFSLAARKMPRGGTAMFAFLALGGDLGCGGGPTLVGFASSALGGLKAGLLLGAVFPVVLTAGTLILRRKGED